MLFELFLPGSGFLMLMQMTHWRMGLVRTLHVFLLSILGPGKLNTGTKVKPKGYF